MSIVITKFITKMSKSGKKMILLFYHLKSDTFRMKIPRLYPSEDKTDSFIIYGDLDAKRSIQGINKIT